MAEDVYVEPVTGRVYSTQDSPFLRVDLCWNHRNLWVNMQQIPVNELSLELMNPKYFEYVIRDAAAAKAALPTGDGDEHETAEHQEGGEVLAARALG